MLGERLPAGIHSGAPAARCTARTSRGDTGEEGLEDVRVNLLFIKNGFIFNDKEPNMSMIRSSLAVALLVSIPALGLAQAFPTAPPKLKEAEAQGLPRVSTEELKQLLLGKVDSKGVKNRHIVTFKADWAVDIVSNRGVNPRSGTWRLDDASNSYCHKFQDGTSSDEDCFAVFRAPDGTHFFDYNIKTGFFEHTWRHVTE